MTNEEAKHKLDFLKKAYQKLIEEKVDSGKLVDDGVRGEWKAETPLDEVYKDMIESLDIAIQALEQQPSEDCINRHAVNDLVDELARAISDERCCMSRGRGTATIMQDILDLPSVTPHPNTGHWILDETDNSITCSKCNCLIWANDIINGEPYYCPNCGRKMEAEE